MIAFACSSCRKALQVKDEFAGRVCNCPFCKATLVVPAPALAMPVRGIGHIAPGDQATQEGNSQASATNGRQDSWLARQTPRVDRFVLAGEIARGGMGAVSRAMDRDIRREVAVKYMLDQRDHAKTQRFIEEAQITGQLEHPNIVPIHELGVDADRRLFFSMKMVHGKSLAQILEDLRLIPRITAKEYPLSRLVTIFVGVCNALAYAHSRGVIHRDLKPANIMVGDFGEVYVMDWGLAKVLAQQEADIPIVVPGRATFKEEQSSLTRVETIRNAEEDKTQDGAVMGTPAYMPPEQATGQIQAIDQRSDVYSLGAILYEMLCLQAPIGKEGGALAMLLRVAEGNIVPPQQRDAQRARAGHIPRELSAIAMKALAKEPGDRYPNVEALRHDVERFQEGRSVSAKEDSHWESVVKFTRRNRALSVSAAVVMVVMMGSMGLITRAWWETTRANAAFQREEKEKQERTLKAVPAWVEAAQLAVDRRRYENAMTQVNLALDYDEDHGGARLLKAQLLILRKDFTGASGELDRYLRKQPKDREAARLRQLCLVAKPGEVANLLALALVFEQQKAAALADGLLTEHGRDSLEARTKLLELYRKRIEAKWRGLGERLTLDATGIFRLQLQNCPQVVDLVPLEGMPVTFLDLTTCIGVRDLTPLKGMPLTWLNLTGCAGVRNLTPLQGMPFSSLSLNGSSVSDLTPLKGIPLTYLDLGGAPVQDLTPLKGMPLTSIKLQQCLGVQDLTPLQGMPLTSINLYGCAGIRDLTPLKGMPFSSLNLNSSRVSDMTPLKGMPLTSLDLTDTLVQDLSPLKDMPLTYLDLARTAVQDLTPLKGMPLIRLDLQATAVQDLTPLMGMLLTYLDFRGCAGVQDLTPLEGMKLSVINLPPRVVKGMDVLRRMKGLARIDGLLAVEFWKKHDAEKPKK